MHQLVNLIYILFFISISVVQTNLERNLSKNNIRRYLKCLLSLCACIAKVKSSKLMRDTNICFDNPVDNPWTFFKPRRLTDANITSRS